MSQSDCSGTQIPARHAVDRAVTWLARYTATCRDGCSVDCEQGAVSTLPGCSGASVRLEVPCGFGPAMVGFRWYIKNPETRVKKVLGLDCHEMHNATGWNQHATLALRVVVQVAKLDQLCTPKRAWQPYGSRQAWSGAEHSGDSVVTQAPFGPTGTARGAEDSSLGTRMPLSVACTTTVALELQACLRKPVACCECRVEYMRHNAMDHIQAAHYGLCFRIAFLEKKGTEFQDWFVKLAEYAFGSDFEAVRPYGRSGDLKCDGRQVSTDTIFQCYAPYDMKEADLNTKIEQDFFGAVENWDHMARWVFVHNDNRGLPPSSIQLFDKLRRDYPAVEISVWTEPALRQLVDKLSLMELQALFGSAPSMPELETLVMGDLQPVIHQLESIDPEPSAELLTPPSINKLEKNQLSEDATELLRVGRRKEALVEAWFKKDSQADRGEQIAEAFRNRYTQLKEEGWSPDQILGYLQEFAYVGGEPKRQTATLAVLSYFFERCDIFDDPETRHDLTNEAHSI